MKTPTFDLYVDDSGSRHPDRGVSVSRSDGLDAFALGGFVVESERATQIIDAHNELCTDLKITTPLHSNKIRGRKGEFEWLRHDATRAQKFYDAIRGLVAKMGGYVTGCVVHRPGYNARYQPLYGAQRWLLCRSAYAILVERTAKYALKHGRKLRIYVEESGKAEDRAIRSYHRGLIDHGTDFNVARSAEYKPLAASEFSAALFLNPQFVTKANPLAQIADLVLYPIVKGRYTPEYRPYQELVEARRLIDCVLDRNERDWGIKYYCFD